MTFPPSNSYKDTFKNVLKYTGQNYRFVPTYLRNRDPIAPFGESPDIKPPEQQGYYPVNSLWTNTPGQRVFLLVGIRNNLANWVLISGGGGGGGGQFIQIPDGTIIPPNDGGGWQFSVINMTITGNPVTGTVTFDATPVLLALRFDVLNGANPFVFPMNSPPTVKFRSGDATVVISGSAPDTIDLSVPGVIANITTDFDINGDPIGTVTPFGNNFKILGIGPGSPGPGTQGIVTQEAPLLAPHNVVFIKYADGALTTVSTSSTTVIAIDVTDNSGFTISATFTAYEPLTGDSFGGRLMSIGRNFAGVVSITSKLENVSGGSPGLSTCSFDAIPVGNQIRIRVKGVAGKTINWHVLVPWIATQNA